MKFNMDYTRTFGFHPRHQDVYQSIKDTSRHWLAEDRIFHPLIYRQYANKFRQGDRVRMRIIQPNHTKLYGTMRIMYIIPYETAKTVLGSYNRGDAFNGQPFTHVLVLMSPTN
jgi:hypothetical protein